MEENYSIISIDAAQDCEDASFWKASALEGRQEKH